MAVRHSFQRAALKGLFSLPRPLLVRMGGGRPVVRQGRTLDPHLQLMVSLATRQGPLETRPIHHSRHLQRVMATALGGGITAMARIDQRRAPGPHGDIPLRLYVPKGLPRGPAPMLVFFHGGGFVLGDLDSYDPLCTFLADRSRCLVLSVGYRLAPEHRFPAPIEDALAVWRHVVADPGDYGADPERIGVGGDSAGGHLSAVLSQQAKRAGDPLPAYQCLIYPVTDLTRTWPSHDDYGDGFLLDRSTMAWFKDQFLHPDTDLSDPRISPLQAESLAGLPPATVILAGFDPLKDEGRAYADALGAAGVPVSVLAFETLIHGFASMPGISRGAKRALGEVADAVRTDFVRA
ncbi:alpha/beta hydrolase [Zavarzinia compransoris]|uniref:Alpha/beta hydrolase n=1 Tax=Zavarzinia compransoris TaxID=1264899 RepID=A0A317E925_9PROT|nr:alpha/beta hydrolase [Zavarzinia compransoris]PWR23231.1 alpha/beta hydrolase [Zavarzinia compransoris]TDP46209.1 acetyl esterase [Zavarzinia compransoris]